ncbi:hypothetical protein P7C70_g6526, partial [Phenoliferia sp. Uapishka_3]
MVFFPALVLASSIAFSSFTPGAEAAVIPLPLQHRSQRPIMREKSFISSRHSAAAVAKRSPGLEVSPQYDEDHSQHWNYHHGYVNKDGHGHGPPHRRSEHSKRSVTNYNEYTEEFPVEYANPATEYLAPLIAADVAIAIAKRGEEEHKTSLPVEHPVVAAAAAAVIDKRHDHDHDDEHWDHDGHWHGHDKREELEARHNHEHDHYHGDEYGHYDSHGHWHHDKRDVQERSWDHEHHHGHHHHWARHSDDHEKSSKGDKKSSGKGSNTKGGKKAQSFGTKTGGNKKSGGKKTSSKSEPKSEPKSEKSEPKSEKSNKHSESKRDNLPISGTPGFVEVATTFLNSTLSRSIAGLVYSVNPDANGTNPFTLGTSTVQSTEFYLTPIPLQAGDSPFSSDFSVVNIRVPILNSQELSTTDYCATFDLTPPSPLSLLPCGKVVGFSQSSFYFSWASIRLACLPALYSPDFAYNLTTSELQPLYAAAPAPMALVSTSNGPETQQPGTSNESASTPASAQSFADNTPDNTDQPAAQSISLFFVPASTYYQPAVPIQNLAQPASSSSSASSSASPSSTPTSSMNSTSSWPSATGNSTISASSSLWSSSSMPSATPTPSSSMSSSSAWPTASATFDDGSDMDDSTNSTLSTATEDSPATDSMAEFLVSTATISPAASSGAEPLATESAMRRVMRW